MVVTSWGLAESNKPKDARSTRLHGTLGPCKAEEMSVRSFDHGWVGSTPLVGHPVTLTACASR